MRTERGIKQEPVSGRPRWRTRFTEWVERPSSPLVFMPVSAAAFWLVASMHKSSFHGGQFLDALISPDRHELWMRFVVTGMLIFIGYAWRVATTERRELLRSLESYQRRLQNLTTELAYADAEERRLIARRLHDSVGQQMAAARMFLASIDESELEDADALRSVSRIVDRLTTEVRELAEDVSPAALDAFGLATALSSLARRIMLRSGVSIEVEDLQSCGALDGDAGHVAFQVIAEVLEFAVRHADEEKVVIRCLGREDGVFVEIAWRGVASADHFSMAERMAGIGGDLTSETVSEVTSVVLRIPRPA